MNFLGMGPMELLLIIVLALIVFGPAKLPEIMGQVGKAVNDFRRATSDLSDEFNRTIQAELQESRALIDDAKAAVADVHTSVNSAVTGTPAPTRVAAPGEVSSTPNGTSTESHTPTTPNGALPSGSNPPLAETTPWSWETSSSPAPQVDSASSPSSTPAEVDSASSPAADPGETSSSPTENAATSATPSSASAEAASSESSTPNEHAKRDELLPPY